MHHAILGPGGVGGMIGSCLVKNGHQVTMVVRPESLEKYPRELTLESPFGNFKVPVERSAQVPPCDVLWITVKATQLESALRSISDPKAVGAMVPLLNGIDHVALLRARYPAALVLPGTIAGETERVAPGHTIHRSPFERLNLSGDARDLLGTTLEQFHAMGFAGEFIDDEATLLWGKLVLLAPFALTTTAAAATKGEVAATPRGRQQIEDCVREGYAVATAEGAKLDPEKGLAALMSLPGNMRSSMQKDVDQGKPPELDAIGGPIIRGGARHRIPVPVTKELMAMVERRVQH